MDDFALSYFLTAGRCRDLSTKSPDGALRVLAKHLDLPMDDAEAVPFLRHALHETYKEIQTRQLQERITRLATTQPEDTE